MPFLWDFFFLSKKTVKEKKKQRKDLFKMTKKILKLSLLVVVLFFVIACGGNTTGQPTTVSNTTSSTSDTSTTTQSGYELPDLTNKTRTEANVILRDLGINYSFQFETSTLAPDNTFLRYADDYSAGDIVPFETSITVIIATIKLILPDLTGMNQIEIFMALQTAGISFVTEIITDNEVEDQTFSSYGSGLKPGDLIPASFQLTVYIGYNSEKLPDLTDKLKGEISRILIEMNILHQFIYVINDDYPEDSFMEYQDYQIGDFYEDEIVVIKLYENTFTKNETSLIISKYVDAGNFTSNQAIEIYNPTVSAISLQNYHLAIYLNGSYEVTYIIDFPDIDLQPGETFVIVNENADIAELLAKADLLTPDLVFDGNDTIQIRFENGTYIDTIYHIGNRDFIMDEEIFVRKDTVVKGSRDFIINQWTAYVPTYIEVLGMHPFEIPEKITFEFIDRDFYDALGGMNLVTLDYINDGDTAAFLPGFSGDQRVRFLGVDTPETYPVVDPWGLEAKAYTSYILTYARDNNKNIYIQSDPNLGYIETYGRRLGLIWIDLGEDVITIDIVDSEGSFIYTEELTGVILLNYHLVKNGFSYNYYGSSSKLVFDNRYLFRWFQDAEKFARDNGLGVHE